MSTITSSLPPDDAPFPIYEDPADRRDSITSERTDDDHSFISDVSLPGADEAIPSIELEYQHDEEGGEVALPYNTGYTSRQSNISSRSLRRASGMTTTSLISSLPSEISVSSKPIPPTANGVDLRYLPRKERPPFRNPSSVRAMQMASPPPFATFEGAVDSRKKGYKSVTPSRSRRSETPVSAHGSIRQESHRSSRQGHRFEPHALVQESPRPSPTPQAHYPLVLLHVTILPLQIPYDLEMIAKVVPPWLMENYKLLEEKLKDIVLMQRGLLIPHPRDEYDLLEERLLESLELKTPRLLKCGHFVGPGDADDPDYEDEDAGSVTDDGMGRNSRMSGGTITAEEHPLPEEDNASICTDCHRQVKKPGKGIGEGKKRWDIKFFAANGLMRAGAWAAAWSEMERVDVEISPWIPDEIRKALEKEMEEQEQQRVLQKQKAFEEAELRRKVEAERLLQMEMERKREQEALQLKKLEFEAAEKRRLEELLEEKIEEAKEMLRIEVQAHTQVEAEAAEKKLRQLEEELKSQQAKFVAETLPPPLPMPDQPALEYIHERMQSRGRQRSISSNNSRTRGAPEIPLSTLLRNYIIVIAQDRRNIAIALLSAVIAFLALRLGPAPQGELPTPSRSRILAEPHLAAPDSPFVVTMTATETATTTAVLTTTATATTTTTIVHVPEQVVSSVVQEMSTQPAVQPASSVLEDVLPETPVQSSVEAASSVLSSIVQERTEQSSVQIISSVLSSSTATAVHGPDTASVPTKSASEEQMDASPSPLSETPTQSHSSFTASSPPTPSLPSASSPAVSVSSAASPSSAASSLPEESTPGLSSPITFTFPTESFSPPQCAVRPFASDSDVQYASESALTDHSEDLSPGFEVDAARLSEDEILLDSEAANA